MNLSFVTFSLATHLHQYYYISMFLEAFQIKGSIPSLV